jgi:flagellar basal body-associated protein FliL
MTEDKNPEVEGGGLELDTLDDFIIPDAKSSEPGPSPEKEPRPESVSAPKATGPNRKNRYLGPTVALLLLVLIIVLAFQFARQDFNLSLQPKSQSSTSEHFLRVGPVSATLPNSDIVQLSVDVGCRNSSEKKRLAQKDSLMKSEIVSIITAPETGKLFEDQQYDEIKARIKKGLEKISDEPVGEVYFSELRIF